MKDISVIIPIFNAEKFLPRCLDSLLEGGPASMEVLLINDGSTDGSAEACARYAEKDDRIVWYSQENRGAVAARNMGLDMACGSYVLFIDADDYVSSGYVWALYETALATTADIVLCNLQRVRQGTVVEMTDYPANTFKRSAEKLALLKETYYPGAWAKLYHRKLLEDNNLRYLVEEGYFGFAEDMLFALHATYAACEIVFCPEAVYSYCLDNENSICSNPSVQLRNNNDRLIIIGHMLDFAQKQGLQGEELLSVMQAVENHLQWGGVATLRIFMRQLPTKGYPREVQAHFQQFVARQVTTLRSRCKEKAKEILRRYPPVYRAMASLYRLRSPR